MMETARERNGLKIINFDTCIHFKSLSRKHFKICKGNIILSHSFRNNGIFFVCYEWLMRIGPIVFCWIIGGINNVQEV